MNTAIDRERAGRIAGDARGIIVMQDAVEQAKVLIDILRQEVNGMVDVEFRLPAKPGSYVFSISTASAICLLNESVELTNQHIQVASDRLRAALGE